jgi:hypothetical protein
MIELSQSIHEWLTMYSATAGDQSSMLVGAAIVLQRVLTLTWSAPSVSKFNIAFCSEYSSLLEVVFAAMIIPACFLTVYRVEKSDDERFQTLSVENWAAKHSVDGYSVATPLSTWVAIGH